MKNYKWGGALKKVLVIYFIIFITGCSYENPVEPDSNINYSGEYQTNLEETNTVILYMYHDGKIAISGSGNWNGLTFIFTGTVMNKHAVLNFSLKKTNIGDLEGSIDGFFDDHGKFLAGGYTLRNEYNILQNSISFKLVSKVVSLNK